MQNVNLKGLPGINRLNDKEREAFYAANQDILNANNFIGPQERDAAAEVLYNNQQFVKKFGMNAFTNWSSGTTKGYEDRNALLKETIVNEAWNNALSPFKADGTRDNNRGLGSLWEKYSEMSTDAKLQLLESNWMSPTEFNTAWKVYEDEIARQQKTKQNVAMVNPMAAEYMPIAYTTPKNKDTSGLGNVFQDLLGDFAGGEAAKRLATDRNNNILNKIYNDDLEERTYKLGNVVSSIYLNDPEIANRSDKDIQKSFYKNFIDENSDMVKLGAGEWASHWGSVELKDLSIDDMRELLAKKKAYMINMSPYAASQALNNEAKRYITERQGTLKKGALFVNDLVISALSYSADKVNGIYNLGLAVMDETMDKPTVLMNERGEILGPKDVKASWDRQGVGHYKDQDGTPHTLRKVQMDRTTLHNMGKNFDGSENGGLLDPLYWTRAEQFGTLVTDAQKQFEKLGSSPYKVSYNPNDESDLWYETFKMASFGIADAAAMMIPFGVGQAGKALEITSKAGKLANGLGKVMRVTGNVLSAATKPGQLIQGTSGALGIAYAYGRGAFQETLAQNLAGAEETITTRAKNEIYNQYHQDKTFKRDVDMQVDALAAQMKKEYLAEIQKDGGMQVADMEAVEKLLKARAQQEVLANMTEKHIEELKNSDEYSVAVQEAINSAGDAAWTTFLPEAIKYSIVNNFGFRKNLYTNSTGLGKKISSSLKGLKEITTEGGKERLVAETSKFLTRKDKWKWFGKTVASQGWGGFWTNATDDMMTDAAERINEDSYNRYLNGLSTGEAIADIYSFIDGLYSYRKGMSNSMGQETTWHAGLVGLTGSWFSVAPNFTNLAHLATAEGRKAYRDTFHQRYKRDGNGMLIKGGDGQLLTEKLRWKDNWREKVAYFTHNGVLNTYYGKKQAERDLQNHADYVNNILDDYEDFDALTSLIAASRGFEKAVEGGNEGDIKTAKFLKALYSVNVLNSLANNSNDPATMSSVVQKAKSLIDNLAGMDFDAETMNLPEGEEIQNQLAQYYAANPSIAQNEYTARQGLAAMIKNAKEFKQAAEAYNTAEKQVQKAEKNYGKPFSFTVREKLKINQALDRHWRGRLEQMQEELGDTSSEGTLAIDNILPSLGGKKNAQVLLKTYERQYKELDDERADQQHTVEETEAKLTKAKKELADNKDDTKTYALNKKVADAQVTLESERLQLTHIENEMLLTKQKAKRVSNAVTASEKEGTTTKELLTADEIFALDPVTRARMMRPINRKNYSEEQIKEIEKLEQRLVMKDADALEKIQDIALLTQRITTNSDAYNRMIQNPEAAVVSLEAQRTAAASAAYNFINQRNAQTAADFINEFDQAMKPHKDVTEEQKAAFVYKQIRGLDTKILSLIDDGQLLPNYQKQVRDAREWAKVVEDLGAVIDNMDQSDGWKDNIGRNITNIVETSNNRDEILANIEKAIDDIKDPQVKQDLNMVLEEMESMGYQRDATVLQKREKKRKRAEKKRKKKEEKKAKEAAAKQAADEAAQVAAAEQAAREAAEANAQVDVVVPPNGEGLTPASTITTEEATPEHIVDGNSQEVEGGRQDASIWASTLMEDGAEAGSVEAGGIWHKEGNEYTKGTLSVSRAENGEITFSVGKTRATLTIAPTDWVVSKDNDARIANKEDLDRVSATKDASFVAESIVKIGDKYCFKGKFEGSNETLYLEAVKNFNLDEAIEREKATREAEAVTKGVDVGDNHIIDNGDTIATKSETIEEQMASQDNKEGKASVSSNTEDVSNSNVMGEHNIENTIVALSGNAMSEWDPSKLAEAGILEHKQGEKPDDSMSKFFAWMDNAGIHLQNIIDNELAQILANNPNTKVKFMAIKGVDNATHDRDVQNHVFLVVDYDNSINNNITHIHNDENGGIIESAGKKYLIIGVAGYNRDNTAKRDLYDILNSNNPHSPNGYGFMKRGKKKFFDEHPSDRFYVPEELETEIVPMSLIPGYIVKQLETDEHIGYRSVTELLADENRNPQGLEMSSLAWGIQEQSQFMIVGISLDKVMVPRNDIGNLGSAFVLIPAANNKMVPSYLKPLFYIEMQDGSLKNRINQLLNGVLSLDYKKRYDAVIALSNIFYFDPKEGDSILLRKNRAEISLVHNGEVMNTFVLNSDFDRQAFFDSFKDMNPRVNITRRVLIDESLLKEYDEAGALMTDVARLSTAGSSYSIYGLDSNGKMLQPETLSNPKPTGGNGTFRNADRSQVVYKHKYYVAENGTFYLNGIPVTDANIIQQLEYNQRIIEGNFEAMKKEGIWEYYALSGGEHPEVVKVNKNTKEVSKATEAEAKSLLEELTKQAEKAAQEEALKEALKRAKTVNLDDEGQIVISTDEHTEGTAESSENKEDGEGNTKAFAGFNIPGNSEKPNTQSFETLYKKPVQSIKLSRFIKQKWPDAPKKAKELAEYLRKKNIEVDAIGTSQEDIDAWMKTIEDCR